MTKWQVTIVTSILLALMTPAVCHAQAGDLDPTFGNGGLVTTNFDGSNLDETRYNPLAIQSDGKLVVVGRTFQGGQYDFAVARYHPDGSLDAGFGEGGLAVTDISPHDAAYAVAVQADGRIIAVGDTYLGSPTYRDFALARYNPDGSLDTSFGSGGVVTTNLGSSSESAHAVAVQPDGRIIAAGDTYLGSPTHRDAALVRYNPDGSLDSSFGNGGVVTTHLGSSFSDYVHAVAVQPDGRIVVAGEAGGDFALARYNPDGSLDSSFDNDGIAITHLGASDRAYSVAAQADGTIIAAGEAGGDFALLRYYADGSLDPSFGFGGVVTTHLGSGERAYSIAVHADGRIVAAGESGGNFGLARYGPDGTLDPSFGTGGAVTLDLGGSDVAYTVAIQADQRIVAAGQTGAWLGNSDFVLVRYDSGGTLDASFGDAGVVVTDVIGPNADYAYDLVTLQADGKLVVVGTTWGVDIDIALARYHPDGTLDTSFGDGGLVVTNLGSYEDQARAVTVQTDGRIVIAGWTGWGFTLVRYNPDGSLDSSFGSGGVAVTHFNVAARAYAIAVLADGRLLAAGRVGSDFAVARFNPDGSLDSSFGSGGVVTTDVLGYSLDKALDIAVQPDGRIVVTGEVFSNWPRSYDFGLVRYNPDGSLDSSFGSGGVVTTQMGPYDVSNAVTIQADGRIVVAGYVYSGSTTGYDITLVRYHPDGARDYSFGSYGVRKLHLGGDDEAFDVALQADGRIVIAGGTNTYPAPWDFVVARFNPDGSLDSHFGSGGVVTTDFGNSDDVAFALAVQADGMIVAAGYSRIQETGLDFALARYRGVSSPQVLIELTIVEVQDLVGAEVLNNGQGESLLKKLQAAIQQLDKGQAEPARNVLEAFINEVDALAAGGTLDSADEEVLTMFVLLVIEQLNGP
ncbi:MAG: delta-60 repeat domain-containing protein [Planctomycetota bacterium]